MTKHLMPAFLWLVLLVAAPCRSTASEGLWLVRVPLTGSPADMPIPVYAHLQDADGHEYVLAKATPTELLSFGREYQVLDPRASASRYWIAESPLPTKDRPRLDGLHDVLLDDGARLLIRTASSDEAQALARLGFEVAELSDRPLVFRTPTPRPLNVDGTRAVTVDPLVQEMLGTITTGRLSAAMDELTGTTPAVADGTYANILTRHTAAGRATERATALAYERFRALGLGTTYQSWNYGAYTNRNVVGTRLGVTATSEVVVVCAHLDSMPIGAVAPGADDNASGSLGVFTAAEVLRHYRFGRTVRFVLFTGEEQGLYGSRAYANAAAAAGDNIVAVLNLDMLSWDGNGDGLVQLHTRPTYNPGYAADRAIADTFVEVVAAYAITNLTPSIRASGITASDHSRFWNVGYAGVLEIEDYGGDFNPYYHTANDLATRINWPYFTSFVQASVGTAAHLAGPVGRDAFDAVRVVSGPFTADGSVGHGTFVAQHVEGAAEADDLNDVALSDAPVGPYANRLALYSRPAASNLWIDARPAASETVYIAELQTVQTNAVLTTPNRLRFDFVGDPDADAVYLARVAVSGQYLVGGLGYTCVTNVRDVVAAGGYMDLPAPIQVTNGAIYGSCEIRRLRVDRAPELSWERASPAEPRLRVAGPPGLHVIDTLEWSDTLTSWTALATITNRITVDDAGFDGGEHALYPETPIPAPTGTPRFYRLERQWLSP